MDIKSPDHSIYLEQEIPGEKCAVFGIYGRDLGASSLCYYGLWALQHRGQDSSGISSTDGKTIRTVKGEGLVAYVYKEDDLNKLVGHAAIGHNRYGTSGGKGPAHAQPVTSAKNLLTIAHNGNLPSTKKLEEYLKAKKIKTAGYNDTELIHKALESCVIDGKTIEGAVIECFPLLTGAFSIVILTKDKMIAVRDSYGIRPFSFGKINHTYVVASETCALDAIYAKYVRDIRPGEMLVFDSKGMHSYQLAEGREKLDVFEFIYFARRDSMIYGKNVDEVRKKLGMELYKQSKQRGDLVIPVPDSGIPAAIGYSMASKIPFDHGFVKNRYVHRTFIRPLQTLRETGVMLKLNPLPSSLSGKEVIVVDDSIVRGTTTKKIVSLLKKAGAKKVHIMISSPPVKYPDFYGIDTPDQEHLIAANMSISQIQKYTKADSLHYLTLDSVYRAIGIDRDKFCAPQFSGEYPIDLLERKKEVDLSK